MIYTEVQCLLAIAILDDLSHYQGPQYEKGEMRMFAVRGANVQHQVIAPQPVAGLNSHESQTLSAGPYF